MTALSETYGRLLFKECRGFPLWDPAPNDLDDVPGGTRIGEIGWIKNGKFIVLPAISLEMQGELPQGYHCEGPGTFTPFPHLKPADLHGDNNQYATNSAVCYTEKVQWKVSAAADVNPPTGALVPVGAGAGGGHQFSHSEGAALILKNGAFSRDCLPINKLQKWISENAELLYYLAQDYGVPNGGLYLVTGFTKTDWWQISAFSKDSGSDFASLEAHVLSALGVELSGQQLREQATLHTPRRSPQDSPQNQTVFLRGWKFMLRTKWYQLPFRRIRIHTDDMTSAGELNRVGPPLSIATSNHQERSADGGNGPGTSEHGGGRGGGRADEAGGPTGGSRERESREGNRGGGSSGNGGQSHGGTSNCSEGNGNYQSQQRDTEPNEAPVRGTSQDSDEDSDGSVESVESDYYPKLLPYHPSDIINKYLLEENLDSQVAMTHDSTWIEALDDDDDLMPNEEELIARIKRRYKIEKSDDGKCVFLMPAADNESLAGTKKTSSLEVERASDYSTLDDREDEDTELEKVINMSLDQALAETTSNTSLNTAEQAKLEQAFVLSTPSSDDFYEAVPRLTSDRLAEHTEPYSVLRSVLLDRDHVIHIDRQANQFSNGRVIENTRPTEGSTGGAAKPTDGSTGGAAKPTEGSMGGAAKPTEGSTGGAVKPGSRHRSARPTKEELKKQDQELAEMKRKRLEKDELIERLKDGRLKKDERDANESENEKKRKKKESVVKE